MKDHRSIGIAAESLYASYEFYFGKRLGRQAAQLPQQETKPMQSTPFRAFRNALLILHSLDYHEVPFLSEKEWESFREEPYDFFMITSSSNASLIWQAIQKRQPEELKQNG
jgi:hypothetical protein